LEKFVYELYTFAKLVTQNIVIDKDETHKSEIGQEEEEAGAKDAVASRP